MPSHSCPATGQESVIFLPNPWAAWSWERRLNPFHARARAESSAWIAGFEAFSPNAQRKFDGCDLGLLAALAYPDQNAEQLRMSCDLMQLVFVFDEYTDGRDEDAVRTMATSVMEAMTGTDRSTSILGAITGDFWQRLTVVMPDLAHQQRFLDAFQRYTDAVVQEAQDRDRGYIRDVPDYLALRRDTAGTLPCWVFLHMGLDLPQEVFDHPLVQEIERLATDMVIVCNASSVASRADGKLIETAQDMLSYSVEHARGDSHSLIGVQTKRNGWSVQEAMDWADRQGKLLMEAAVEGRTGLPSFGVGVDRDLALYVDGLCNWVRACDAWSFEGQRYFGELGPEIQKHRQVILST